MASKPAAAKAIANVIDVAFFKHLWRHYNARRDAIRSRYRDLTKRFLDFNDPAKNPNAFLRRPQFEALEMYVYLKERLDNRPVYEIFDAWYHKESPFEDRAAVGLQSDDQLALLDQFDEASYKATFERMKTAGEGAVYSNYIFALTMGTGKTILMGTCIFYDFLLANKYPDDKRYVHNALVFAPDKTVLHALREMQTFDRSKVVPPDYSNVLDRMITFHFLEDVGTTLDVLSGSRFNLIISNTQKIILKRTNKEKSAPDLFFGSGKPGYQPSAAAAAAAQLYDFETLDDIELTTNQRFEKLRRLEQLGIYIDEAHHAFGNQLERDLLRKKGEDARTSLRRTVDELASELKKAGTRVVACFNYTGTPYAKGIIFPDVVYAFGLKEAIDSAYLKKVTINGYTNPKTTEFVREVLTDFFTKHPKKKTFEGLRPKIAFFASTIDEVTDELRPAVEKTLSELGLSTDIININVGDDKFTTHDDIRDFNSLDTPTSEKQVILLVNKGKEGWNCRSLFGVALYRKPKSKVFVLQATMRCLRAIAHPPQQTGHVYLSEENLQMLDEELNQNFRVGLQDLKAAGTKKQTFEVHTVPPPRKIKLKRISQLWQTTEREPALGIAFDFESLDVEKYRLLRIEQQGLTFDVAARAARVETDLSSTRERRKFSALTLTAEIARYLNRSAVKIEEVLRSSREGMHEVLKQVNDFNEVLYEFVIPKLFQAFFDVKSFENMQEEDVVLVREPEDGYYRVLADPADVVRMVDNNVSPFKAKSFHLDLYSFDSNPERHLFLELLPHVDVKYIYFTGMLTHGQSDFFIEYIDPDSHAVRSYYPDFLIQTVSDSWIILEVKRDDQVHDLVVEAKKDAAEKIATAAGNMTYTIIPSTHVAKGVAKLLFGSGKTDSAEVLF